MLSSIKKICPTSVLSLLLNKCLNRESSRWGWVRAFRGLGVAEGFGVPWEGGEGQQARVAEAAAPPLSSRTACRNHPQFESLGQERWTSQPRASFLPLSSHHTEARKLLAKGQMASRLTCQPAEPCSSSNRALPPSVATLSPASRDGVPSLSTHTNLHCLLSCTES